MEKPYSSNDFSPKIFDQRGDRHRQHLCHPSLSEFWFSPVHLLPHENLLIKLFGYNCIHRELILKDNLKKQNMKKWYSKYLQSLRETLSYAPAAVEVAKKWRQPRGLQRMPYCHHRIGHNEERHLLACLWSLSEMQCRYPVEIIGVDNESKTARPRYTGSPECLITRKRGTAAVSHCAG